MNKLLIIISIILLPALSIDAQETDTVWTWGDYKYEPQNVKFMPDGNSVLVGTYGGIYRFDLNGNIIDTINYPGRQFDIYPGGDRIVFTDDQNVVFYDLTLIDTIKKIHFDPDKQFVYAVAITKDVRYIIVILANQQHINNNYSYEIKIYDANTYDSVYSVEGENSIWEYAIDEQNGYFLTVDQKYTDANYLKIVKWKIGTWEKVSDLVVFGKEEGVQSIAISPDCKYLAVSMDYDGKVNLYDYNTGQFIKNFYSSGKHYTISFSNNSKYIVAGSSSGTYIWDIETNNLIKKYSSALVHMELSKDNQYIIGIGGSTEWYGVLLIHAPPEFTGINPINIIIDETVYPNPATDYIEINVGAQGTVPDDVSIFDVLGIEVQKSMDSRFRGNDSQFPEGTIRIDISSLSPGVYFVRIGDEVRKFVKI